MWSSEEQHVFTSRCFCGRIFVSHNLLFGFNRPTNEGASSGQLFRVFVRLRRRLGAYVASNRPVIGASNVHSDYADVICKGVPLGILADVA